MDQAGKVDPELQASISNLVSALGGPDTVSRQYKLGDEALACLRDLRKWLQLYDASAERLDVACAIANTTLVSVDLVEILSQWEAETHARKDAYLDRVALACLELLVPLTWPLEVVGKENTVHYFSQLKYVQQSQARYKQTILKHASHNILRAAIRLATPALRAPLNDRDVRNEGILTLVCLLFRNLVRIESGDDDDRRDTASEFADQKVLSFLVMLGAGMGRSFDKQDVVVLECLYFLLRGVDVARLYGLQPHDDTIKDPLKQDLRQMLDTEADMNRDVFKPSRHSRFGTMIAMNEGQGEWISVSGQRAVTGLDSTLAQLDKSKRWHRRSTRPVTDDREKASYAATAASINSDAAALATVATFANEFLDAAFNPLFVKLRKLVERQQPRVSKQNLVQYLSLVAWFLDVERSRCDAAKQPMDFKLVGGVLNRASIAVVLTLLRRGIDPGELQSTELVQAAMVCFRQTLVCVRSMGYADADEYTDAAESIKSRLFYEETWLNLLALLPRHAAKKSLSYACEAVQLTHIVLKMLDEYSKQHTYMFVKSRRARRGRSNTSIDGHDEVADEEQEQEQEREREQVLGHEQEQDHQEAARVTSERKFSFAKFVTKYIHEATIDTYERVLASYRDVSEDMILQVFSFFRRTYAATEFKAYFYRLSLMRLLLALVDHRGLPRDSRAYGIAEQFLAYYVRKFATAVQRMPSLHIQVNEVMTPADAFYYDHNGHDKEVYRPPRFELELKSRARRELSAERQFAIIVAAMIDRGQDDFVKWASDTIAGILLGEDGENDSTAASAATDAATDAATRTAIGARRPLTTQPLTNDRGRIKFVHGDALARLFLRSMGIIVNAAAGHIVLPSSIDEAQAVERLGWVQKYRTEPVEFERGEEAMSYIKVQGESDGDDYADETDHELSAVQPEPRRRAYSPRPSDDAEPAEARVPARAPKRTQSDAFALDDSDDEGGGAVMQSVASLRRKARTVDDEDEDDE